MPTDPFPSADERMSQRVRLLRLKVKMHRGGAGPTDHQIEYSRAELGHVAASWRGTRRFGRTAAEAKANLRHALELA